MTNSTIKTVREIISNWWLMLLGGIALLALGIWTITTPLEAYLSLSLVFAIGILTAGVFEIIFSLSNTSKTGWGWTLVSGMIDLFIGGYLLSYPALTMAILPVLVGVWILFRGFIAIGNAFEIKSYGFPGWGWLLCAGIVAILVATLILVNPVWGIANIVIWTGVAFILAGIFRIYLSLKLRKLN